MFEKYAAAICLLILSIVVPGSFVWSGEKLPSTVFRLQEQPPTPPVSPVDLTFGQGTDINSGKAEFLLALPKLEHAPDEISPAEAQSILNAATASLAVYDNLSYTWPAGWALVEPELRVERSAWTHWVPTELIPASVVADVILGAGFHAAAYRLPSGEILIAFEGTDPAEWGDVATDLAQAFTVPGQYTIGVAFAKSVQLRFPKATLTLTGHSLGGGIAQYAAAMLGLQAITFNPAGLFPRTVLASLPGRLQQSGIKHYVTRAYMLQESSDPVSFKRQIDVSTKRDAVSAVGMQLGDVTFVPVQSEAGFLGVHSMARLHAALSAIALVRNADGEDLRVIGVVDSSGSMNKTDPKGLRLAVIRLMIDTLPDNTLLTLLDFDDTVTPLFTDIRLGPFGGQQRKELRVKVAAIDADGGTAIGKGLAAATALIGASPVKTSLVLLTDGIDKNWSGEKGRLPAGVAVHTIALSAKADGDGLSRLSGETGGIFEIAQTGYDLPRILGNLFGNATEQDIMLVKEGLIKEGEIVSFTLRLPSYQNFDGYVDVAVSWPGSDIDLTLIDPTGNRLPVDKAVRDGNGIEASTYDIIRLADPRGGTWTIELHGVDLPGAPEPFTLRATSSGGPVKARWVTNTVTPEVGKKMSFDLATEHNNVVWKEALIDIVLPSGSQQHSRVGLGKVATVLGGGSGQNVLTLEPKQQGIHRVSITAEGVMSTGEQIERFFDRTFQVAPPGKGIGYEHTIDPFIRRGATMEIQ